MLEARRLCTSNSNVRGNLNLWLLCFWFVLLFVDFDQAQLMGDEEADSILQFSGENRKEVEFGRGLLVL